jgi:hypothetical protein
MVAEAGRVSGDARGRRDLERPAVAVGADGDHPRGVVPGGRIEERFEQ